VHFCLIPVYKSSWGCNVMKKRNSNKFSLILVFIMLFNLVLPNISLNTVSAATGAIANHVVISQIYGANGNAYKNDFIELYNPTGSDISLSGWSVQYASATGTNWSVHQLSGTIKAYSYYLVVEAAGTSGTVPPPSDATPSTGPLNLSGTTGKVALSNKINALSGQVPIGAIDLVGFGTATGFEGTGAAPAPSNTTSIYRRPYDSTNLTSGKGNGWDSDDNKSDFIGGVTPNPRNSASPTEKYVTKVASVTSNVAQGAVPAGVEVQLSTSTPNATIYYTINGDNPTTSSTIYTSPFTFDQDTTIKAFATAETLDPSDISTYIYTIIDTIAPSAPFVNPVTNADEVITGTAEANASVIAKVNGQEIGTSIVDTDGFFAIQIPRQEVGTTIFVTAKDSARNSSSATEITVTRANFKVNSVLLSVDKQSPQILGTPVTLTANSSGSFEPEYRFFVRENGNLTVLQEYRNNDSITWTPSHSGFYTIIVHAKDKMAPGTGLLFEARTEMTYAVNGGKVTNVQVSSDLSSPLVAGTPISLQATSVGSVDPEYRFFVRENGNLTTLQEYGKNDSVTWNPHHSGIYTIIVHAKDKMAIGADLRFEARTEMTYVVNGGKVTNVQVNSDLSSPQVLGTPISLKASSVGSLEPEYRFFIRENGNLTTLQEYGNSDSITWTPSHSGIYTIIVHAKDKMASGADLRFEARTEMTYVVNGGKVTNVQLSSDLPSPQALGTAITFKATSVGSLDPEYRFFVLENGNLITLQEYGNSDTITWTPSLPGTYTIIVHARDKMAPGAGFLYEARTELTFIVS
jgi:hypothetical protein